MEIDPASGSLGPETAARVPIEFALLVPAVPV
jgi:hypothetical protein